MQLVVVLCLSSSIHFIHLQYNENKKKTLNKNKQRDAFSKPLPGSIHYQDSTLYFALSLSYFVSHLESMVMEKITGMGMVIGEKMMIKAVEIKTTGGIKTVGIKTTLIRRGKMK